MPVIKLTDVSKLYGFGNATTVALDEVNLNVESGEFIAIMGPSGSGKSTLLNMVGLLDTPTHGEYKLGDRYVSRLRSARRAKVRRDTIGFVFQSFNLLNSLTVLENVALPLAYKGMTETRRSKRAGDALEQVGLSEREYFYPYQLSGGQAQRAAVARAIVNKPQIIIADEPTGNLDSTASRVVMELLSDIHKSGSTILMVTHNPELTRYATRVVFMHDGSIISDENSKLGEVPDLALTTMYSVPNKTFKDDVEGVSALMKEIPKEEKKKEKPKQRRKTTVKKYKKNGTKK